MDSTERDEGGAVVRIAWVAYCIETGDTKPSHIAPYSDLGEWDKEADRRIFEAVRDYLLAQGVRQPDVVEGER